MEMNPNRPHPSTGSSHVTGSSTSAGAGTDTQRGHPLPCGRTVEQVWDDMETGAVTGRASAHPVDCPHCTTARASLHQLAEATQLLVADPVEPPSGLLDKVMAAVRADLARGETIPLPAPPGAVVDISAHALAAALRFVVDGVSGVRAHRCRIELDTRTSHTVRVWMSVSLHYGSGQISALEQARARVGAALSARIGLRLDRLDFEVADVWIDDGTIGAEDRP